MWNKTRTDEGPGTPRPAEPPVRMAPPATPASSAASPSSGIPMRAEPPSASRQIAAIGASMTIKGDIRAREELLVDGEVEGSLESQSSLTVGPNGKVRANIKAREVVVYGSVRGNVEVAEKIAIRDQGSLVGDIKAAGISIDDGAYFKGSIDIVRPEPKVTSRPVKNDARPAEPKMEASVG